MSESPPIAAAHRPAYPSSQTSIQPVVFRSPVGSVHASEFPMIDIPVKFPSERDRLRRLIEADRGLGVRERIQAIDGMLATVNRLCAGATGEVDHDRLRRIRKEEVRRIFREFIQRQLERVDTADGPAD